MAAPKPAAHQSRSDDIRRLTLHLLHFELVMGQQPIRQINDHQAPSATPIATTSDSSGRSTTIKLRQQHPLQPAASKAEIGQRPNSKSRAPISAAFQIKTTSPFLYSRPMVSDHR
ncbi:hypothetical protein ACLOJK_024030 [Asimina triloba]